MEVGADRRGRRHGVGQPEVEGELGGFAHRPERDEEQRGRHRSSRTARDFPGQQRRKVVGSGLEAHDHETREHREAGRPGDEQGHAGPGAGFFLPVEKSDEEERGDAGKFPEREEQEEVAREHRAQHRRHEEQEVGVETSVILVVFIQIRTGVEDHERSHRRDDQAEEQRQPVDEKSEVDPHRRYPRHLDDALRARRGVGRDQTEQHGGHDGRDQRAPGGAHAEAPAGEQGDRQPERGEKDRKEEGKRGHAERTGRATDRRRARPGRAGIFGEGRRRGDPRSACTAGDSIRRRPWAGFYCRQLEFPRIPAARRAHGRGRGSGDVSWSFSVVNPRVALAEDLTPPGGPGGPYREGRCSGNIPTRDPAASVARLAASRWPPRKSFGPGGVATRGEGRRPKPAGVGMTPALKGCRAQPQSAGSNEKKPITQQTTTL